MKKLFLYVLLLGWYTISFTSCENNGSQRYVTISDPAEDGYMEAESGEEYEGNDKFSDQTQIRLTGVIETCNKCMGYGMVQDGLYGQPEICKFCWMSTNMRIQQGWTGFDGRFGQVDAVFNSLPADFFDELDWNAEGGYDDSNGGTNREEIEREIERHERNLELLRQQQEYIEGSINSNRIRQEIIEEEYAIKRLRMRLENM